MIDEGRIRSGVSDRRSTVRLIATGLVGTGMSSASATSAPTRPRHPVPPCGAAEAPSCSRPDAPPAFASWRESDLSDWQPPTCLGWSGPSRSAEAVAATFRFGGTDADLLAHIGNLALHSTIRYWSTSQRGWRRLITSAEVVADVTGNPSASAFTAADFAVGKVNHYAETTARSGRVVYRLRTLFRSAGRIVLATDNAWPIHAWGLRLFDPGALQSVTFLERRGTGLWTYYAIARAGAGASRFASGHGESCVNRLVALFRFTAGIPTDAEPPVAQ